MQQPKFNKQAAEKEIKKTFPEAGFRSEIHHFFFISWNGARFISNQCYFLNMNILFICNQNQHRSRTAEDLFRDRFNTRSAGLYNDRPVTEEHISWADTIIVMEEVQRTELAKRFPKLYMNKRILSLDVPDIYRYNQPELIAILNDKMEDLFEPVLK